MHSSLSLTPQRKRSATTAGLQCGLETPKRRCQLDSPMRRKIATIQPSDTSPAVAVSNDFDYYTVLELTTSGIG